MRRILVAGSLNMDMVIETPKVPALGETLLGGGFFTAPGGKGANQAAAAARLGGSVAMAGCVGSDMFGAKLKSNLEEAGVDTKRVRVIENVPTGVAVIAVCGGDNFIIVDAGANGCFSAEDVASEMFEGVGIAMTQLEIPAEAAFHFIKTAKESGARVLLNPAPAREIPRDIFSSVDILTPNETECSFLIGSEIKNARDAAQAVPVLLNRGVKSAVITLGEAGAVYNDGEEIRYCPVEKVIAVDATAAGDCFSAALAVALCEGRGINEAVAFACKAASLSVTKKGAQDSLPYRSEVNFKFEAGK